MQVSTPEEIIIHGTTSNGKTFRPSDWAERLCGILSSFDKGNRLSYHQWVRPILIDKVRCVAIGKKLEDINPPMFRFLMDFAADNDLCVMTFEELFGSEKHTATQESMPSESITDTLESVTEVTTPQETFSAPYQIREIKAGETSVAFAALSTLRPNLTDINRFIEQVDTQQRPAGYALIGLFEEGKNNAIAVCGYRVMTTLAQGKHLRIDDIVTIPQGRNRGYGSLLLTEIARIAKQQNISQIHTDLEVGSERSDAHRLYYYHGFEISDHHFMCKTDKFRP